MRWYRALAIVVLNGLLFAALLNVPACLYLRSVERPREESMFFGPGEKLASDPELVRRLYPGRSDEEIRALIETPGIRSHPTLEFMENPVRGRFYEIGPENARLDRFGGGRDAKALLDGATWVFGGSTTFGEGVAGDETLVAYLNVHGEGERFVNLGTEAAHQSLEIDRLVLLLKKGYRPKRVIFFDGLNDFAALTWSNYAPEETPMEPFLAYRLHYNPRTVEGPLRWRLAADAVPLVRAIRRLARGAPETPAFEEDIHSADALYHRDPDAHYRALAEPYEAKLANKDRYAEKLARYYRGNLALIAGLWRGFGFEALVFFQPFGTLALDNPYVRDRARYEKSAYHVLTRAVVDSTRAAIASGALPGMIDLSDRDRVCCYVDAVHYGPALNEALAREILATLRARGRGAPPAPE